MLRALSKLGQTVPESLYNNVTDHSWSKYESNRFNLRIGPSYSTRKRKAPSMVALYEPYAMDIIRCGVIEQIKRLLTDIYSKLCRTRTKLADVARYFTLPDTSHIQTHHSYVQPIFVVNLQLSSESPSLFSSDDDGPGYSIIMYFQITQDTCDQLKDLRNASPAVKLFAEYCKRAPIEYDMRARFKVRCQKFSHHQYDTQPDICQVICKCDNIEEIGFSSFVQSYNSKPVLINGLKSGTAILNSERRYFEMDIHSSMFSILARQTIQYIMTKTSKMLMSIGFTIEGREDYELPEVLLGCIALNRPHHDRAKYLE